MFMKKLPNGPRRNPVYAVLGISLVWLSSGGAFGASLTDALTLAEQSDPTYREAQATALAVAEGIPQARAVLWLPDLSFTAGGSHNDQEITTDFAFGNGGGVAFQNYDYRLHLTQPVYHRDRHVRLQDRKSVV